MPLALRSVSRLGVARLAMAGRRVGRAPWVAVARHSTLAQPATAPAAPPLAALAPRKLSPQSSLAHFHSTPTPLAHPEPEDPDARNPSKAAIVAQLLKDSKALDDAKDALSDSAIGPAPAAANAPAPAAPEKKAKEPLWNRIKHEIQHYYHGTRLFIAESRISFRLLLKMSRGVPLTRREHKQLVRTSADMFRLIPMMVFIVVPFMEFALPLALKIWPNMLPSTFESKFAEEEKRKKLLKVRLDVAKFLQDTISEISVGSGSGKGIEEKGIKEFGEFFGKVRWRAETEQSESLLASSLIARLLAA